MKSGSILVFVMVSVFLISIFPIAIFSGADKSHEGSGIFGSESTADWWPMFHHDLTHTGCSTSAAPHTNATLWSYATNGVVFSSPAVVGGVVYVGSNDGRVYALNALNGTQLWHYTTSNIVHSSPAVAGGVVYVGSNDGRVYALNASTGTQVWNYTTSGTVESSPAVAGGVVYVGSLDGKVYALNASNGIQVWNYTTAPGLDSSPAAADGFVYVGSDNVYCLNSSTGAKVWNYAASVGFSSPTVTGDLVYIGSADYNVYALYTSNGTKKWNYKTGSSVTSSPAVAGGVVYVGSTDNGVYALNASTGTQVWNYTTSNIVHSSPAVAGGVVYVGSFDGLVYALDAATGSQLWSYATPIGIASSPAVVGEVVYVGSEDTHGIVYAFGSPERVIDLYGGASNSGDWTGYPLPFPTPYGGQGPNQWMDLVFPQSNLTLYTNVTYGNLPVVSVPVNFTIDGPYTRLANGTFVQKASWQVWAYLQEATNQDGVAEAHYGMPWSEAYREDFTGVWNVNATVLLYDLVVSDQMKFFYQPLVNMTSVSTDAYYYEYAQSVKVTVVYTTYSMQTYPALFQVDLTNSTNATFSSALYSTMVGGAVFGAGKVSAFTVTGVIPFWPGVGGFSYVHVNCFDKSLSGGGVPLCPEYAPPLQFLVAVGAYSNVTLTNLIVGHESMNFTISGPGGQVGDVYAWIPATGFNSTDLQVFVDGAPVQPSLLSITIDGAGHYLIHFELALSTHDVCIEYAAPVQAGGGGGRMPYMT
jgi:outer membrane protein assembly factor BamB